MVLRLRKGANRAGERRVVLHRNHDGGENGEGQPILLRLRSALNGDSEPRVIMFRDDMDLDAETLAEAMQRLVNREHVEGGVKKMLRLIEVENVGDNEVETEVETVKKNGEGKRRIMIRKAIRHGETQEGGPRIRIRRETPLE